MAATVRVSYYGGSGSEPAGVTAETGVVFALTDTEAPASGTGPVTKPSVTGTTYTWIKQLAFEVTATAATDISARTIKWSGTPGTGTNLFWADQATYRQPASGNRPADSGSAGPAVPTPAGSGAPMAYAAVTTSPQTWDNASVSAGSTGRNGDFVELVAGVDNNYGGGSGQYVEPDAYLAYTES